MGDKTGGGGTGGLGVGALENRGWECYMRQDEKELELGGWEAGAIAADCATKKKRAKGRKPRNKGREPKM